VEILSRWRRGIAALEELSAGRQQVLADVAATGATRPRRLSAARELGQPEAGMKDAAKSAGVPVQFNRCGSMFCAYFTRLAQYTTSRTRCTATARVSQSSFTVCWTQGFIWRLPSSKQASLDAHTSDDIEQTIERAANDHEAL
jgi:glutamate-1-semialdehyde aminotransferase